MHLSVRGKEPKLGENNFVAPTAVLIGDVVSGQNCSFWFNVVVRGDVASIRMGDEVNVQDGCIVHGTYKKHDVKIESGVSIGHAALIHGCHIEEDCLIGMGAIVMDGARIGRGSIVAAGALVSPGQQVEPGSLVVGRPAKKKRQVRSDELDGVLSTRQHYLQYKDWYDNIEVNHDGK